ncbi:TetR/AcrR family transcriptional regulator [Wansuia hejianensis]|uniref:TetR/AcrR family transcriptional regulator n=1 Tax=Wansuia hejianensis TaxID=2763667 RepID=A0A926EW52_9FIRM|nr:TetR/AcrR family transcriptional regulator [Wansuia hejianensis]MBC8590021.1 TetR/AcrR family transcriptional regulator [Wansuia hejianensis]
MKEKHEKSFEKRDELIKAALLEFGDKGYDKASLNNILKEAGISKGTFYYHFKNKEDLYLYLIEILIAEKMDYFNKNIDPRDLQKDIFTLLKTMIEVGIGFAHYSPEIDRFSATYIKDMKNPIFHRIKEKYSFMGNDYLDNIIEKAYERGELREDLPKDFTKNMIKYLLTNLHEISQIIDLKEYATEANYLIEFFKGGLGK